MSKFFRKLWPYLLALVLLVLIALIGDGRLKVPFFNKDSGSDLDTVAVDVDSLDVEAEPIYEPAIAVEDTAQAVAQNEVVREKMWRLVVGSFPEKERAQRLADKLSNGAELMFVDYMGTYRVVYGSYSDLAGAQQAYSQIEPDYPESWVVYF